MADSSSNFKLIFVAVFIVAAGLGLLVFSGIIKIGGGGSQTAEGSVTLWGTFDSQALNPFLEDYNQRNQKVRVEYVQKDSATFRQSLIEALASGKAPDLIMMPDNLLWGLSDKLTHIPYASLPQRTFADTFISGATIFSESDGTVAIPFAADPLILYYNRDIVEGAGIAKVPTTWTTFSESVPLLTKKQSDLTLIQSGVALGTYKNITHAKDIIALLFLENSNPVISSSAGQIITHFGATAKGAENDVSQQALNFYMAFSDPVKNVYSWNGGQTQDRDAFLRGTLAYYFGFASELPGIRAQNPNLNFDVVMPPQSGVIPITTGRLYGLAIPKSASNQVLSYTAATLLVSPESQSALTTKVGTTLALMPVRRDILATKPVSDPYATLLYNATLVMRPWFDPDPQVSGNIFSTLISDISSGVLPVDQALNKASAQFASLSKIQ